MILSESEKNRIRALHREASVIKQPLNEQDMFKVLKKIYNKLPQNVKQAIEKAKEGDGESQLMDKAKNFLVDYLEGNQGIVPGDQTELKKKLVKDGEEFIEFFVYSPKDREYMRKMESIPPENWENLEKELKRRHQEEMEKKKQ